MGSDGFWEEDYGWGARVRRPFGARGMSSIRYGIRLGDLKNKQPTHTRNTHTENTHTVGSTVCVFQRILHAFLKIAGRSRVTWRESNGAGVLAAKLARRMRHAALLRTPYPARGTTRCSIG